jgi:hypothetical protein
MPTYLPHLFRRHANPSCHSLEDVGNTVPMQAIPYSSSPDQAPKYGTFFNPSMVHPLL